MSPQASLYDLGEVILVGDTAAPPAGIVGLRTTSTSASGVQFQILGLRIGANRTVRIGGSKSTSNMLIDDYVHIQQGGVLELGAPARFQVRRLCLCGCDDVSAGSTTHVRMLA